jgi:hypothetical protein
MITLLKKISPLLVIALLLGGCKKTETINPDNDLYTVQQHVKSRLTVQEYSSINWGSVKKSVTPSNEIVYTFTYTGDKNRLLMISTNKGALIAQTFSYAISNQVVTTVLTNLESGSTSRQTKTLGEITHNGGRPPIVPNTGGPTLPEVVLVAYINNNIPNRSNPTVTDLMMFISTGGGSFNYQQELASLDPNSSNYGQSPILGPVLEFESMEDALAYLEWVQDLNPLELLFVLNHPLESTKIFFNSNKATLQAIAWAQQEYPNSTTQQNNSQQGGKADALRHAYWTALNTASVGQVLALQFAAAHEYGASKPATISQVVWDMNMQMDVKNNGMGWSLSIINGYNSSTSSAVIWNNLIVGANSAGNYLNTGLVYICNDVLKFFYESC